MFKDRIIKTIEISTAHLTAAENIQLSYSSERIVFGVVAIPFNYGVIVKILPDWSDEDKAATPPNLLSVLKRALEEDITIVIFDRDADLVPGLPSHNW